MTLIAFGQITPDEHHGGAGRDAEQDRAGDIGAVKFDLGSVFHDLRPGQQILEKDAEKQTGDGQHGEWLDAPVDEQGEQDRLGVAARFNDFTKVDLHHDGIHHEEEADRDGNGDHGRTVDEDRHAIERPGETRRQLAKTDASKNAQPDPQGELTFEEAH